MTSYFKTLFSQKTTAVLLCMSLFSIALSVGRVVFTGKMMFLFMFWNLFLAFVPWFLSTLIYGHLFRNRFLIVFTACIWLLFFPNAPYILTDLVHLGKYPDAPKWFDLIMLLSYGLTGMMYGFVSLKNISDSLTFKKNVVNLLIILMIYVSCFGIYLGRFLRWNSWDLIYNIDDVLLDVFNQVADPLSNLSTWVFTFLLGTLLNIFYWGLRSFEKTSGPAPGGAE